MTNETLCPKHPLVHHAGACVNAGVANDTALALIARLGLEPLPHEGGFFRPTWRNDTASAIFFLITPEGFSALHRMTLDEVWFFHAGDPIEHMQLDPCDGAVRLTRLGNDVLAGDQAQIVVPAGVWQGTRLAPAAASATVQGFALVSCVVSPPWDERAFTLGSRAALTRQFPNAATQIVALTRDDF